MDTEYPENRKSGVKAGVLLGFRDGVRADREVATGYTLAIQYPTLQPYGFAWNARKTGHSASAAEGQGCPRFNPHAWIVSFMDGEN